MSDRPYLIVSLDGFLSAGHAPTLIADVFRGLEHRAVASFDLDDYYDYRARRPPIAFRQDHYDDLAVPSLEIGQTHDLNGVPFYFLVGPEPDYRWEQFTHEFIQLVEDLEIGMVLFLGAVPMGVPHTRPLVITSHGTKPELVDRSNVWEAEIVVPSSAMSYCEYKLGRADHDAGGYVVHVPHYLAQVEYPTAALALLDAVSARTGLRFDIEDMRRRQAEALSQIEQQIDDQDGSSLLSDLEQQYDAFTRGAETSLLAEDEVLPSADELAQQFEHFLAARDKPKSDDD